MKSAVEIEYNLDRALTKAIEKAQQLKLLLGRFIW